MDKHNGITKEMMTMITMGEECGVGNEKHGKKSFSSQCFTDMNKTGALLQVIPDNAYEMHTFGVMYEVFLSPYHT